MKRPKPAARPRRSRKLLPKIKCQNTVCGISFRPNRTWQKYHSKECKDAANRAPRTSAADEKSLIEIASAGKALAERILYFWDISIPNIAVNFRNHAREMKDAAEKILNEKKERKTR